jgi:PKD repeat protein
LGSPTAEDLDADCTPEIVVGAQGGHFYAVEPDGTVQADHEATVGPLVAISSPAIADVDDDGVPEVSVGVSNGIQSLELTSEGFVDDGKIALPSVDGQDPWVAASPAVADIDGDEDPDLLGSTVPINVSDEVVNSDALPGRVFAVDGASLADADTQPRWSVSFPDDGGISGPIPADVDDDGRSEVLAGEGIPIIGNASTLHYVDAGNPVVEEIAIDPSEPTTQDTVTFDADATDESNDDASLSYAWDFGDGTTSEAETPTHSFADDGTYNVSVTVTDPDGHAWTETTQVQVDNVPPDVTGTVDTTPGSLEATVTGTADDPDGTVEETTWAFGDGQTATTDETTHTYPTGGTYTANFTAVDDDGDARTVQKTVDVNRFPSLDGNETAATAEGETLTVALAADDPDGDPVRVTDVEGPTGARADLTAPDEVTLTWTPDYDVTNRSDTPATTDITVTVEDAGTPTGTAEASVSVDVENTNRPPSLTGPEQARASSGQTTVLDGQADDADGNDVTLSAEGLPASASFAADGEEWRITVQPPSDAAETTHTVTIQADDGQDVTEHQIELEIVPNRPPEASIAGPTETQADTRWSPNPVTFEGQASDPDGDAIRRWSWNVSGVYRSGAEVTQAFDEHGTYKVELTAKDTQLAADTTARNVTVDDALTGDLVVHRAHQGPNVPRLVHATVTYDDGTPLAGTAVDVAMRHEGLDLVTQQREVVTDADGSLVVELDGDVGGLFVPGEHTVSVTTQAPSLASAPIQDTETLAMEDRFAVGLG